VRDLVLDARAVAPPGPDAPPAGPGTASRPDPSPHPPPDARPRRPSIVHVRTYRAASASRVPASGAAASGGPTACVPAACVPAEGVPAEGGDPGCSGLLDFAVVADRTGPHAVAIAYDHGGSAPLAIGLAVDRAQARTVRYAPLEPGTTRRTTVVTVHLHRGPGVIRVAEGPPHARLHVHSLRVAEIVPARDAAAPGAHRLPGTHDLPGARPVAAA